MEKNIYMAGVGGQGLQVVGKAMAQAAYNLGYKVTYSPRYGFEKRGGLTSCYVVISDDEVGNPRKKLQDILVVMEPKAYARFKDDVKPGGTLIVNSTLVPEFETEGKPFNVYGVPLHDIVVKLGNTKVISAALMGAIAVLLEDIFPNKDILLDGMLAKLKGKEALIEINKNAFNESYDYVKAYLNK